MSTPPTINLHLFFARQSDRAVILRQGPYKLTCMILWDRATDTFTDGQWLKHRVYADRSDLSPDGRHFLYFALDGAWASPAKGSYTAISRAPYFTALALFPQGHTWGTGGFFLDNRSYVADGEDDIVGRADDLARCTRTWNRDRQAFEYADENNRPFDLPHLETGAPSSASPISAARTHPGYVAKGARLYRRRAQDLTLIRDFSDMHFTPIRAPYDWREPGDSADRPWHPLDRDTS